jgi:hypothetical protein
MDRDRQSQALLEQFCGRDLRDENEQIVKRPRPVCAHVFPCSDSWGKPLVIVILIQDKRRMLAHYTEDHDVLERLVVPRVCRMSKSASRIPPMTPKRTTSVKSR